MERGQTELVPAGIIIVRSFIGVIRKARIDYRILVNGQSECLAGTVCPCGAGVKITIQIIIKNNGNIMSFIIAGIIFNSTI